jgi:hypothetical protein
MTLGSVTMYQIWIGRQAALGFEEHTTVASRFTSKMYSRHMRITHPENAEQEAVSIAAVKLR